MSLVELFERIPGQDRLLRELQPHVASPKNSYFFIGPQDGGVLGAAKAFAKAIMCAEDGCGECQSCRAIENDVHPDVTVFERSGAALSVEEAQEITSLSVRSTQGSRYRIIIVPELELVGRAAPVLLKSVEEPPVSTVFILLASLELSELRTLMSRSVVLRFDPLFEEQIYGELVKRGFGPEQSKEAVRLSAGRWSRAVELAGDPELREAFTLWEELPQLLRQDMAQIVTLADRLIAIGGVVEDRRRREHKREIEELIQTAKAQGVSSGPLKEKTELGHKRELRRISTGELRAGLLLLERHYRNQLIGGDLDPDRSRHCIDAIREIEDAQAALKRNCNEFLMLVALLCRLADKAS